MGPFLLENIGVGAPDDAPNKVARYKSIDPNKPWGLVLDGWGRQTFPEGRWAQVRYSGGDVVDVGDCDDPGSSNKFTCSLSGKTVLFTELIKRTSSEDDRQPSHYENGERIIEVEPFRREPIKVPRRNPYVLPGMP